MDLRQSIVRELHKPARRNFPRRNTVVKGLNDLYQADLVEMIPHARINKGYKYILTMIDCFSKFAYAIPLKNKSAVVVGKALNDILKTTKMKFLQTDEGKEYYNSTVKNILNKHNIIHYSTNSEKKAAIVERFNRTLKEMMYKRFSLRGKYIWYDILDDLVNEYNVKKHRIIGMAPSNVNKTNEQVVLQRIKKNTRIKQERNVPRQFFIGERVRISKLKGFFTKGYHPNWSNEIFTIYRVQPTTPQTYILKDHKGQILKGGFYGHELLKSKVKQDIYLVERVIRKKGDKVLVRWLGFDKSEDSWIPKRDLF